MQLAPAAYAQVTPQQPQTLQPSSNWSGYLATNAYYTGVSALIQAPQPYAPQALGVVASWVGIGGASTGSHDLIQAGVEEVTEGFAVGYDAWYEMLPGAARGIALQIEPGAWVMVDIHELGFNQWRITIVNGANVFQRDFLYPSSHSSAEWIVEEPALYNGRLLPLSGVTGANFSKMTATANGQPASPPQLFPQSLAIVSPIGSVRAAPTGLGSDGASFSVTTI